MYRLCHSLSLFLLCASGVAACNLIMGIERYDSYDGSGGGSTSSGGGGGSSTSSGGGGSTSSGGSGGSTSSGSGGSEICAVHYDFGNAALNTCIEEHCCEDLDNCVSDEDCEECLSDSAKDCGSETYKLLEDCRGTNCPDDICNSGYAFMQSGVPLYDCNACTQNHCCDNNSCLVSDECMKCLLNASSTICESSAVSVQAAAFEQCLADCGCDKDLISTID